MSYNRDVRYGVVIPVSSWMSCNYIGEILQGEASLFSPDTTHSSLRINSLVRWMLFAKKTPNLRHMIPTYSYIGAVLLRQFSGGFKKEHSTEGCWSADHWAVDPDLAHLKRLRPPEGRTKCRPRTNLEKEHLIPLFHLFFLVVCFHVLNAHLTQLLRGCI